MDSNILHKMSKAQYSRSWRHGQIYVHVQVKQAPDQALSWQSDETSQNLKTGFFPINNVWKAKF